MHQHHLIHKASLSTLFRYHNSQLEEPIAANHKSFNSNPASMLSC